MLIVKLILAQFNLRVFTTSLIFQFVSQAIECYMRDDIIYLIEDTLNNIYLHLSVSYDLSNSIRRSAESHGII